MENPRGIIDLPVEVLDLIFKHLTYLSIKLQLAQAHEKLTKAFVYHSRNEFRRYKLFESALSEESMLLPIRECGRTIEDFVFEGNGRFWNDALVDAIGNHCTNLKSVKVLRFNSHSDKICTLLVKLNKLLLSVSFKQESRFPFVILKAVGEMTQLKKLSVKGYIDENVYEIQKLVALEKLKVDHNYYLDRKDVHILKICSSLKNLRELSITNLHIMPCEEEHSKVWVGLETLTIFSCTLPTALPDCPNLKDLSIHYLQSSNEDYCLQFILKNGKKLDNLYEKCRPPIDANGFLQLLRGCPNLRYLYTPMEYIKLYSGYVSTILEILRENKVTREDPFVLVICRRIKWKWFRRLLSRTPNAELIRLPQRYEYYT
ncbi:uncharacterized protein LOC122615896 [Drosophila teissieri]|uniref:uncharacterized protein LOC122615896 n=1 Tax=Drosophila teissieri TaxID=7243 RepID=UPI001CBA5771|nr:uncharacterized protein LOC122615896 [Drosophila teissieri]